MFLWIVIFKLLFLWRPTNLIGLILKGWKWLLYLTGNARTYFCFITIGSLMIIFNGLIIVVQNTSPYSVRWYIYVSSRWCLWMKKGVLLLIVVFVWVIFGAIDCLRFVAICFSYIINNSKKIKKLVLRKIQKIALNKINL